ncbi:hypothetical protein [Paenibacillus ginsengihumi]|uniref:hypothetical protein n=1 Tax=Paenibacillus ginsengihumi TaxID=431596 RepID=UPI0012EC8DB9|nr:hypothetical protein [Paenibacillus ginsengihumi]
MATGKPPPVSMPHTIPSFAKIHEFPFAPAFFGNASGSYIRKTSIDVHSWMSDRVLAVVFLGTESRTSL